MNYRRAGIAVISILAVFSLAPRIVRAELIWQSAPSHTDELKVYTLELSHRWFGTEDSPTLYVGTWDGPDFTTDASTTVHMWARWDGNTGGYYDANILDVGLDSSSGGNPYVFSGQAPTTTRVILSGEPHAEFTYQTVSSTTTLEEMTIPTHAGVTIHHGDELWTILIPHVGYANFSVGATGHTPQFQICEGECNPIQPSLTPVIIIPGILGSAQHNGEWLIDPITHTYDNLIDTLAVNGYEKEKNLFTFPYDWHKSNIDTAVLLKQKIDAVKAICNCNKVDLVAHSMGGLVARWYIQSPNYDHDVRKIIFLGTPHLGAPEDYLMWEGGQLAATSVTNNIENVIIQHEALRAGYQNAFDYIQQTPIFSVRELLPIYNYLENTGSYSAARPDYPSQYPRNFFLENINAHTSDLLSLGIQVSNFVGELTGSTTVERIKVIPPGSIFSAGQWPDGYPENFGNLFTDEGLRLGLGDGRVPISSASYLNQNLITFEADHSKLVTAAEGDIFKSLTGTNADQLITGKNVTNLKMLLFEIRSPADIVIVAPDGKRAGKDFLTGQEFSEIPDAFYSGFQTDNEFVTIPNPLDGEYKIITQGTGLGGEYTLATGVITDSTSTEIFFSGQTLPNLITEHDVNVDTSNPGETEIVPADQTPPIISIIQPATTTYIHSDFMPVNITFVDDTGVATSGVIFDTTPISASSTVDLFFRSLGAHTLVASATDLVNNATTSTTTIQVIATYDSTVSDINRAFNLGWILKKDVKKELLNKLAKVITLEKKIDTILVSTKPKVEKKVERLEKKIDKVLLRALVKDVQQAYTKGKINNRAYQMLTADFNWLIGQ
ncbi:MAG: hypothetical protein UY67_C0024G0020 [Candidatus Kaiserbacteria bacterium GW2011_GWA2_52_12]|uniref:PGAP1 family protein n=2 Tax=Candidatus Kaiseribacteriota TaxID=1752734 RepID=A0A0G1WX79_9BACT|nr:MAG: hypothetical protein UY67_C0024G0020 [Candidatus Kaiserbacteria bacterium GW2011_GWA2_52_12]